MRYGVPALVVTLGALAVAWVVGDVMVAVILLALAACWPIGRWVLRHGRFPRWLRTWFYRSGEWRVGEELWRLAVEEDGLLWGDHRTGWSTFQKAIATQDHLFLYMENVVGHMIVPEPGNPALIWGVIIVPRSLVSGDFDDFLRQVRGHVAVLDVA